jgi:hypothetical protein
MKHLLSNITALLSIFVLTVTCNAQTADTQTSAEVDFTPPKGIIQQNHLPAEAESEYELGANLYFAGNHDEALPHFLKAAKLGNSLAAFEVGWRKERIKQYDVAGAWYKFASANGNTLAIHRLATLMYFGKIPSTSTYMVLDSISGAKGSSEAMQSMYSSYKNGDGSLGVRPSVARSNYWQNKYLHIQKLAVAKISTLTIKAEMAKLMNDIINDKSNLTTFFRF